MRVWCGPGLDAARECWAVGDPDSLTTLVGLVVLDSYYAVLRGRHQVVRLTTASGCSICSSSASTPLLSASLVRIPKVASTSFADLGQTSYLGAIQSLSTRFLLGIVVLSLHHKGASSASTTRHLSNTVQLANETYYLSTSTSECHKRASDRRWQHETYVPMRAYVKRGCRELTRT